MRTNNELDKFLFKIVNHYGDIQGNKSYTYIRLIRIYQIRIYKDIDESDNQIIDKLVDLFTTKNKNLIMFNIKNKDMIIKEACNYILYGTFILNQVISSPSK